MAARRPKDQEPLRVLVLGVGHLGRNHARVYSEIDGVDLVAVVDPDASQAGPVAAKLGVPHVPSLTDELLSEVHAVSVVTPTPTHFDVAARCIEAGVSVLVEKPMTSVLEDAKRLRDLAAERGVTLQVGHIERFNPVVVEAFRRVHRPVFIECDRIHPFSFRSTETGVVLDLMIHDIDLVLQLVNAPVDRLDAAGAPILSESEDLANSRITFANGCTAMIKTSRVAIQKSRKMRIFCEERYVSVDYVARTGMCISMKDGFDRSRIDFKEMARLEETKGTLTIFTEYLQIEQLVIPDEEPLRNELEAFAHAVRTGEEPVVPGDHGVLAMEVATRIQDSIAEGRKAYVQKHQERIRREGPPATHRRDDLESSDS